VKQDSSGRPRSSTQSKVIFVGVGILGVAVGLVVLRNILEERRVAQRNVCIANLKQMDLATASWSIENKKLPHDTVDVKTVSSYLKGGVMPVCPAAGEYQLTTVGRAPTCTISGHELPPGYWPKSAFPPW
jgi:hypothetical protein